MFIKDLFVSQEDIRNCKQIPGLIDFVKNQGVLNDKNLEAFAELNNIKKAPLINIVKFPDNKFMIHDGHHRCVSILLAGRDFLHSDEYIISNWDYSDYTEVCFENNWFTPFNPIFEVRQPEFYSFKEKVSKLYLVSERLALDYIEKNKNLYCKLRKFFTVKDLALKINERI